MLLNSTVKTNKTSCIYPPASKASREVANLTERKNQHSPVYGVKEFVHLFVLYFDPNYLCFGVDYPRKVKEYTRSIIYHDKYQVQNLSILSLEWTTF